MSATSATFPPSEVTTTYGSAIEAATSGEPRFTARECTSTEPLRSSTDDVVTWRREEIDTLLK